MSDFIQRVFETSIKLRVELSSRESNEKLLIYKESE